MANELCTYCYGVGGCPKCWGKTAVRRLTNENERLSVRLESMRKSAEKAIAVRDEQNTKLSERLEQAVKSRIEAEARAENAYRAQGGEAREREREVQAVKRARHEINKELDQAQTDLKVVKAQLEASRRLCQEVEEERSKIGRQRNEWSNTAGKYWMALQRIRQVIEHCDISSWWRGRSLGAISLILKGVK